MIGSFRVRYATKAMLATAEKTAVRGTLNIYIYIFMNL